jgi:PhnB protein
MAIKGARPEHGRITPHLLVRNSEQAIEFYKRAMGAEVLYCSPMPHGRGVHAHLRIAKTVVMLTEESAKRGAEEWQAAPESLGGTSTILELYVDDVDAAFQRAVNAGAKPTLPVTDMFWGDRYGWITDPYGHIWALATAGEELTPEQIQGRLEEMMAQMKR